MRLSLFTIAALFSMTSYSAIDVLKCTSADGSIVTNSSQVTGLADGFKLTTEDFNGVKIQNIEALAGTRVLIKNNTQTLVDRYINEAQKATLEDHSPRVILGGAGEATIYSNTSSGACNGPSYWVQEHAKFTQNLNVTTVTPIRNQLSGAWELRTITEAQLFYCNDFMTRRTDEKPCIKN